MKATVLVVCEGNICRSPMAQGLLASRLSTIRFVSAGLSALSGRPADSTAVELMAERGIDISGHIASPVNLQYMRDAGLVLTMTMEQKRRLAESYAFATGKVFRLGENDGADVIDPYRQNRAVFEASIAQIEHYVSNWIDAIIRIFH
ncbi:low molecular weight protein-tyrosine-phosphatase [Burkholderia vietnamiensis]|uniref:low molecular weight protein-tyrosine-phosphatase n=1 Tax=Burkholderia vietnamiensis TaxID=60552 RepID=UPI00075543C9|nr:low molecular weight protein-tyrosine-phosphatase [Burkholderia vietnamiensis]KVF69436.1 protein tyrosine phosphatase [Burkholderia vietnamiensis]WHU95938.1 low molecular weight phosphotyrosine protein phosphatase [Burkholderia vietnamiensis]HDR9183013.1 low molecular weight phosphotyrosine protein phosphatase [Burkholderia vietnamiensis]